MKMMMAQFMIIRGDPKKGRKEGREGGSARGKERESVREKVEISIREGCCG